VKSLKRDLKKEAEALVADGTVEDYRFGSYGKHKRLEFKHKGAWHHVTYSGTPRTEFQNNYVRQGVRRKIRELAA